MEHLTRFLADERGRILLDNALGEGLGLSQLLSKGVDARRRSIQMKGDELDRRIAALEQDLLGKAGTIEQRRIQIREDVSAIKVGARKDLERFVDDVCRQLPNVIDAAKPGDLKQYLPAFLEDAYRQWAEEETKEIAVQLERLAEKTVALVREDAHESAKRVAGVLGSDARRLDVQVDTIRYDVGVVALMFGGVALMAVNLMVGGILAVAAPAIFAMFARGRIHEELKKRAKELAPEVMKETAKKVAPKLDAMIDEFAQKLDAWVVSAGEELHREVIEVLRATKDSRAAGQGDEQTANAAVEGQAAALVKVTERIEKLRAELWALRSRPRGRGPLDGRLRGTELEELGASEEVADAASPERLQLLEALHEAAPVLDDPGARGVGAHGVVRDAGHREAQRGERAFGPEPLLLLVGEGTDTLVARARRRGEPRVEVVPEAP